MDRLLFEPLTGKEIRKCMHVRYISSNVLDLVLLTINMGKEDFQVPPKLPILCVYVSCVSIVNVTSMRIET